MKVPESQQNQGLEFPNGYNNRGGVKIGEDVLIAPNTYINCDIPDHSIVFGNPCMIKHNENATDGYINRKI